MNIYDISQTQDPTKCYSKTLDERKYPSFEKWFDAVHEQENKLQYGIFAYKGNFYYARFQRIDLTEREHDPISNMTTTVNRIIKFKWSYQYLK